jgi:diguanylate cyclase (GGDEF)-like protein
LSFNDKHGHSAGDELIVLIAQALRTRLRDSDVIARLGGDEFAVLLPAGDEEENQQVADALLDVVREEILPALDPDVANALTAAGRRTTVSIGIARFDDAERLTAEEVLVNGDLAMYDAKDAGGGAWARYRSGEHPRAKNESHVKWAEEIEHAIAHDGFELLAQPIIALRPDGPAHYELLLRMHDRADALVHPASFLYIAERLGLIGAIDRWVVERALDILAAQRLLGRDLRVEVNLSARTIGDEQLLEVIEQRLRATDVPPDRLVFELTETAAVANVGRERARATPRRPRLQVRPRRLRRRIRIGLLSQTPPVRLPEDRCRVRRQLRAQRNGPHPDRRRRPDRARNGQTNDRRTRRRPRDRGSPQTPRRRLRTRLLPRPPRPTRRTPRHSRHPHQSSHPPTQPSSESHGRARQGPTSGGALVHGRDPALCSTSRADIPAGLFERGELSCRTGPRGLTRLERMCRVAGERAAEVQVGSKDVGRVDQPVGGTRRSA